MMLPTYHHFAMSARRCLRSALSAGVALLLALLTAIAMTPTATRAQSAAELMSAGDRESAARHPALALPYFERVIQLEPSSVAALCKAARELVDLGEFEANETKRTALYSRATDFAKRAIAVNPNDADAHFHLSRALGRTALALGARDRVKYGIDVRTQALRALELAPRHPGALHVMGVWNAEVMRLNGFARLVAKTFLGGQIFGSASWAEATRYMEQAVSVEPERIVHRLDMARVYRDTGRKADARAAYQAAIAAPLLDANDDRYRDDAKRELQALGAN